MKKLQENSEGKKEFKDARIHIRTTTTNKELLQLKAQEIQMSLSEFLIAAGLGLRTKQITPLINKSLYVELCRQGNNLNQLTRLQDTQENNLDLNYWLPEKLKKITQKESNQEIVDPKQWQSVQQKLMDNYGIPEPIATRLNEINLVSASDLGNPIWHKRNLLDSSNNHFWFGVNDNDNPMKKMIVTSSAVEAVSAYLINDLIKESDCPCLYVSCDSPEQIKELDLTSFDTIVVSRNDQQIFSDNIPNLVVEKDVSSWQQTWRHEFQRIMELEARKKNSLSKKTSKKQRQLEM